MMHCKQMKPISSANNTKQKRQQIKTTPNKKDNNMTSKFHKVVHGFAFDKGVVNESKKPVAITVSLQFDRVLSPFILKKSCSNLVVAGFLFFYWYILLPQLWAQGGGCKAIYSTRVLNAISHWWWPWWHQSWWPWWWKWWCRRWLLVVSTSCNPSDQLHKSGVTLPQQYHQNEHYPLWWSISSLRK